MKNRIWLMSLVMTLCIGLGSGCQRDSAVQNSKKDKISVVCTIFPEYDWVKEVIGQQVEDYELTLLMDNGTDLHNYQPTVEDIAKISDCDLFIYVGGESDTWAEDALKEAKNEDMQVINLMDVLSEKVKEEEIIEGMEADEHDHEHEKGEEHEHDEAVEEEEHEHDEAVEGENHEHDEVVGEEEHEHDEIEYDEHVWLSLKNAEIVVEYIEKALEVIDSEHAESYQKNSEAYLTELHTLDQAYESAVQSATRKTLLFGDRFPFRYLVEDYGLDYYAAFIGCSTETEASFETITFLSEKVDEMKLPAILVIESSDQKIAESIINNTEDRNQNILVMNSLQSINQTDIESGANYISIMTDNLETLKESLS